MVYTVTTWKTLLQGLSGMHMFALSLHLPCLDNQVAAGLCLLQVVQRLRIVTSNLGMHCACRYAMLHRAKSARAQHGMTNRAW